MSLVSKCTPSLPFQTFYAVDNVPGSLSVLPLINIPTPLRTYGIHKIGNSGAQPGDYIKVKIYATGAAGNVFNARLVGFQRVSNGVDGQFDMLPLAYLSCTVGAVTGPTGAACPPLATHNFATFTIKTDGSGNSLAVAGATVLTDLGISVLCVDPQGCEYVQLLIESPSGGTPPTNANGLIAPF